MLLFDMMGLHTVLAYSRVGRVIVLKVEIISSLCLPHLVDVSALRMLSVRFALVVVIFMCCENVSFGSKVTPRILGCLIVGNVLPLMLSDKVVLYSAGSGVKRVVVVLSAFM